MLRKDSRERWPRVRAAGAAGNGKGPILGLHTV